jgi:hypothetical protein
LLAVGTLVIFGNPVELVKMVAVLFSLAVAPVLYALNLYCVQRHIKNPALRPTRITLILGWMGTFFMLIALGVTFYVKLIHSVVDLSHCDLSFISQIVPSLTGWPCIQ